MFTVVVVRSIDHKEGVVLEYVVLTKVGGVCFINVTDRSIAMRRWHWDMLF